MPNSQCICKETGEEGFGPWAGRTYQRGYGVRIGNWNGNAGARIDVKKVEVSFTGLNFTLQPVFAIGRKRLRLGDRFFRRSNMIGYP